MKKSFGQVIKNLRFERNISRKDLASELGVSEIALRKWEEEENRVPRKETLEMIANYFNVDEAFLLGYSPIKKSFKNIDNIVQLPIYSFVKSQDDINENNVIEYITVPSFLLDVNCQYLGIIMQDDSLIGSGVRENDIAIFKKCDNIKLNQIGLFALKKNKKIIIRKFFKNKKLCLKPSCDVYDDLVCDEKDIDILGTLATIIQNRMW